MPEVKAKKTDKKSTLPAKPAKPRKAMPKVDMEAKYDSTGKYNPKAAHNVKSWKEVQAVLPATYKEIQAKIPEHTDFVGYLIRREGLAPSK